MIPHSAAFEAAVVQTHEVEIRVEVLDPEGSGEAMFRLFPNSGGNITRGRGAGTSCEFTVAGSLRDMVPSGVDPKVLLPFGTEVRIWRGIAGLEALEQGVFRLIGVEPVVTSSTGVSTRFRGKDRSSRFGRKSIVPFTALSGENAGEVLRRWLTQVWIGLGSGDDLPPFRFSNTDHQVPPLSLDVKTDGWDEGQRQALGCGKELFVEYDGGVAFVDLPSLTDLPVWQFVDGVRDTRVKLGQSYDADKVVNYWTVNAAHPSISDQELSGTVWVDDSTSPIFVGGKFGTSPDWFDSPYATSELQCQDEARARRAKALAGTDVLVVEAVPNEALLERDVVLVTCEDLDIFDDVRIIDTIDNMPLDGENVMRLTLGRG